MQSTIKAKVCLGREVQYFTESELSNRRILVIYITLFILKMVHSIRIQELIFVTLLLTLAYTQIGLVSWSITPLTPDGTDTTTDSQQIGLTNIEQIDGMKYKGTVSIKVAGGEQENFSYEAIFVQDSEDCLVWFCFNGYISKYEQLGQNGFQQVLGYQNSDLLVKPTFRFETNGPDSTTIRSNPELSQLWTDIIEVACHSFNPAIQGGDTQAYVDYLYGIYSPKTTDSQAFQDSYQNARQATYQKTLEFTDVESQSSTLDGRIIFIGDGELIAYSEQSAHLDFTNADALLSDRQLNYSKSELISFEADIVLTIEYVETIQVPSDKIQAIEDNSNQWTYLILTEKLEFSTGKIAGLQFSYRPQSTYGVFVEPITTSPGPGYRDNPVTGNEQSTGVNVIEKLNAANNLLIEQTTTVSGPIEEPSSYLIYDEEKVLYTKTVLGNPFQVSLSTQCNLTEYTYDVKLLCNGRINTLYLGQSQTVRLFVFQKSVSFEWSSTDQKDGRWGGKFFIPLSKPANYLGINLNINFVFVMDIILGGSVFGSSSSAYTYQFKSSVTTNVTTDTSVTVRIGAIEGGVQLSGNLVQVESVPIVRNQFRFSNRIVNLRTLLNANLLQFNGQWSQRDRLVTTQAGQWGSWRVYMTRNFLSSYQTSSLQDSQSSIGI